jgi:hypothetical protein
LKLFLLFKRPHWYPTISVKKSEFPYVQSFLAGRGRWRAPYKDLDIKASWEPQNMASFPVKHQTLKALLLKSFWRRMKSLFSLIHYKYSQGGGERKVIFTELPWIRTLLVPMITLYGWHYFSHFINDKTADTKKN